MNNKWLNSDKSYTVKLGFEWLKGPQMKVGWHNWVWSSFNIPKHSFIAWIVMLGKLKTRDRLKAAGVIQEAWCPMCSTN